MFVNSDWTEHEHLLDDGQLVLPVGAFLVRTDDHLALLDAGVGHVHDEMFDGGALLDNLQAAGVMPDEIDTIIVSHLHPDHIGWLEVDDDMTFANATIHIGAGDWRGKQQATQQISNVSLAHIPGYQRSMTVLIVLLLLAVIVGVGAVIEGLLWMFLIGFALLVAAVWFGWSRFRGSSRTT